MKFVIENNPAFGSKLVQCQPYDILLARYQQEKAKLAGKRSLQADVRALIAINCPDEPHGSSVRACLAVGVTGSNKLLLIVCGEKVLVLSCEAVLM